MKTKIIRHGEVVLKQVSLPKGAVLKEEKAKIVVAHSETGHHHILSLKDKIDMSKIKVYSFNGDTYLEVPEVAELWHQKSGQDVHKTHTVTPAVYQIVIKKEFDYFSKALKAVRD